MNRRKFFSLLFGAAAVGAVAPLASETTVKGGTIEDRRRALGAIREIIDGFQPKLHRKRVSIPYPSDPILRKAVMEHKRQVAKMRLEGEWPHFDSHFDMMKWVGEQNDIIAGRV